MRRGGREYAQPVERIATVKHLEPHRGKNAVGDDTVPRTREELLDLADECLDIPQPHCVIAALQLDEPGARDALGEVTTGGPGPTGSSRRLRTSVGTWTAL
jgi:hypothetical protein